MIEAQENQSFTAWLDAAGEAGLVGTLTVQIDRPDGSSVVAATTGGITEVEPGIYAAALDAPAVGHYAVIWNNAGQRASEELRVLASVPVPPPFSTGVHPFARRAKVTDRSDDVLVAAVACSKPWKVSSTPGTVSQEETYGAVMQLAQAAVDALVGHRNRVLTVLSDGTEPDTAYNVLNATPRYGIGYLELSLRRSRPDG